MRKDKENVVLYVHSTVPLMMTYYQVNFLTLFSGYLFVGIVFLIGSASVPALTCGTMAMGKMGDLGKHP